MKRLNALELDVVAGIREGVHKALEEADSSDDLVVVANLLLGENEGRNEGMKERKIG